MKLYTSALILGFAFLLVGCGVSSLPQERLTAAKAAVRAAEVGGAAGNPKAALHLKYARDQIAEASQMIEDEEHELAEALLERAEVDAELALSLARVEAARQDAQAARDDVEELKKRQLEFGVK